MKPSDLLKSLGSSVRSSIQKLRERLPTVVRLGVGKKRKEEEVGLIKVADLPSFEELAGKLSEFPELYSDVFSRKLVQNRRLFVAREEEREAVMDAVARWREGRAAAVALVGPDWSGKTSLLNRLEEELSTSETAMTTRFAIRNRVRSEKDAMDLLSQGFGVLEPCASMDELVSRLLAQPPRVVLVDDGQRAILRAVRSARGIETLLAVLLATRAHFIWIVSFGDVAWRRFEYRMSLSRYFSHVVEIPYFKEEDLKAAILSRLKVVGLTVRYVEEPAPQEEDAKREQRESISTAEFEAGQERLAQAYFHTLYSISSGNMQAALFFWMISAHYNETLGFVEIQPCKGADLGLLQPLEDIYLLTLAELFAHGGLTLEEHSEIFQRDLLESRVILDSLCDLRLVEKVSEGEQGRPFMYRGNPVFYTQVLSTLESRNFLY